MTEEQLINNINRSRRIGGNQMWYNIVRKYAYKDMTRHNEFVNWYKDYKHKLITEFIEPKDQLSHCYRARYFNSKGHYVMFTKYSKVPRYRSYRQQLAITNRTLEKRLYRELQQRI